MVLWLPHRFICIHLRFSFSYFNLFFHIFFCFCYFDKELICHTHTGMTMLYAAMQKFIEQMHTRTHTQTYICIYILCNNAVCNDTHIKYMRLLRSCAEKVHNNISEYAFWSHIHTRILINCTTIIYMWDGRWQELDLTFNRAETNRRRF